MLNNVIKASFAALGLITGFTVTNTVFSVFSIDITFNMMVVIYIAASLAFGYILYFTASKVISTTTDVLDRFELVIQKMTLYELLISALGLIAGLVIANLISIPLNKIDIIGVPLSIVANLLFGYAGIAVANGKKHESLFMMHKDVKSGNDLNKKAAQVKLLDTSIIIDGRIVDICRSGFIEGELVVPVFVLEELRHIADSPDTLKRNRGRRGLDILNILQKELLYPVRIENIEINEGNEVDDKLLKAAKMYGYSIITIDFNLSKVASFQGVQVLNINELANAVKPIALPGEEMTIQVIKDGKENGQGIGYLDDGTMIVVEGGRRHIGETVSVTVTSVLQTAAGRMIFAKPKCSIERVI